jgi:pSer/pThr/pTyr-binding forkhead associated (FHA) protein
MPPHAQLPAVATVIHDGRRLPLTAGGLTVGRLADNDIVIPRNSVSRQHARITPVPDGYWITDLGSRNGTQLNGERFRGEARWLSNGDTVVIGGDALRFVTGQETRYAGEADAVVRTELIAFPTDRLTIGRDHSNDVALDDPNVSRFHAEVVREGDAVTLRDLGSRNGTRVDGTRIDGPTRIRHGAVLSVGVTTFTVDAPPVEAAAAAPAVPDAGETRAHVPQGTVIGQAPRPAARERTRTGDSPPPRRRQPAPAAQAASAETAQPFGRYQASGSRRRRKAATRLWLPQALTYAAVVGTAVGLVLYFA